MKLYDSKAAPNPRRVRIFLAEKAIVLPIEQVDLGKLEQRNPDYSKINPLQRIPALVFDDGEVLCETVAICRYFEEIQPEPPLFGVGAREKARVEMWQRRAELEFFYPVAMTFRHTHPAMKQMEQPQIAEVAETMRPRALAFARFLDGELAGRRYLAGDSFTIADITALVAADFTKPARIALPEDLTHMARWRADVSSRPSAAA